jgi:hypothetical protein
MGRYPDAEAVAAQIDRALDQIDELRYQLGRARSEAGDLQGSSGLVELDLRRALTALGAADLALKRAQRNVGLEVEA